MTDRTSVLAEALGGASLLARGFVLVFTRRRLFLLGALPPLITSVIFLALLITEIGNLDRVIPHYPAWIRVLIGIGAVGGSMLIMVLVFTAVTLAIGGPAYEKISDLVERELEPRRARLRNRWCGRCHGRSASRSACCWPRSPARSPSRCSDWSRSWGRP
ncbi:hypothetical protein GCM10027613_08390 [Microlunatus endophyticus]